MDPINAKPMMPALSMNASQDVRRDANHTADQELREAAKGFEGLFLQQFLKAARKTEFGDELTSSSAVNKTRDLFDMEVTQSSGGLGISEAIYTQFSSHVTKKGP